MKNCTTRITAGIRLFLCLMFAALLSWGSSASAQTTSIFGPNVYVFTPSMSNATIQSTLQSLSTNGQFDTTRSAVLFMPGTYSVESQVGFYQSVAGLGMTPGAVTINGYLTVNTTDSNGNITTNFWRSIENMAIDSPSTLQWGVSQGAAFRRMDVIGPLELTNTNCGYASGGFISDTVVTGTVNPCSQQQWYTRNSTLGGWSGSVWNMVFSGVQGAPAQSFPNPPMTTLATTPVSREKPFLYVDANNNYNVFVPTLRTNSTGTSWSGGGLGTGYSLAISTFFIATPSSTLAQINAALAAGQNLILTPGIYQYNGSINVTNAKTIILGMGYATVVPQAGTPAITVADVDGVQIAGLLIDAGPISSPVLLQIGVPGATRVSHASNPTSVNDVFFRIGGATAGTATTSMEIDSNNVILDNIWAWRADHGADATWTGNIALHGLVVNGDNVTALGLAAEHYQQEQVLWNGNGGETIFYQSEMPYDPPSQAAWMDNGVDGYPSYVVSSGVTTHQAYGIGVYSYFNQGIDIIANSAISVPVTPGVSITDALSVFLTGSGSITHVVNNTGAEAQNGNGVVDLAYFGGAACSSNCAPNPPTQLTATAISTNQIDLSWTASSTSGVTYSVLRNGTPVAGGLTGTTYTDSGLSPATAYSYTVQSVNANGSAASNTVSATTESLSTATPVAPTNLTATVASDSQVNLSWTASTTTGVVYTLVRNGTPLPNTINGTTFSDKGLMSATAYTYTVETVDAAGTSAPSNAVSVTTQSLTAGWTLVWSDEFNAAAGTLPNPNNWAYDIGGGGWGNSELEIYCGGGSNTAPCSTATPNAYQDGNGNLVITAINNNGTWTSARMHTAGSVGNFSFTYGRVEARLKLTVGNGLWPAFWMLGMDGTTGTVWPANGEDDIMEWVDTYGPSTTSSTSHGPGYSGTGGIGGQYTFPNGERVDDASYHTYGLIWSQNLLQYYRDDPSNIFLTVTPASIPAGDQWVYNNPFYILLNFAVGGDWFAGPDATTPSPATMLVDYVRVYTPSGTTAAPNAPTNLTGTAASSTQINLSWTASTSTGVTSYSVLRNGVAVGSPTGTTYSDTGLTAGTAYTYTVEAVSANGSSVASNAVTVTTQGGTVSAPAAPTNLAGTAASSTQINLTWTASTTAGVTYSVLRGGAAVGTATGTTYSDTGLTASTAYTYTVKAVNTNGTSAASNAVTVTTLAGATAPAAPTNLAGTAASLTQINLTWTASTTAGVTYSVLRGGAAIGTATGTTYSDTGLTASTAYTYTVKAVNTNGTSAASNAVTVTTLATAPVLPAAPTNLAGTAASSTQINLTWTASATAGVTYSVLRGGVAVGTATGTTYSDTGLTASTAYTYTVEAVNANGTSPASNAVTVTTAAAGCTTNCDFIAINSGGAAAGSFVADADYNGGATSASTAAVTTSGVTNPAPVAVYQSQRYGTFTYTIPGLTAGTSYPVRLHFAESYWTAAGDRTFNVSINGTQVLTNFDIFAAAGGTNIAVVEQFTATASSTGQIVIAFTTVKDNAAVNGIEILSTAAAAPAAPSNLAGTAASTTQINLTWTASATSGVTYSVLRNGNTVGTATGTTYSDTGLTASTAYTYTVKAVNANGTSAASNAVTVTTQAAPAAPAAPSNLAGTAASSSQINLTWTASTTSGVTYSVLRGGTAIGTATGTTYSDTGLTASTAYTYSVKAVNANGTSAASNAVTVTTLAATCTSNCGGADVIAINTGGTASGSFVADVDYTSGAESASTVAVNTTGVTNAAPAAVYLTQRYGNFTYTIPGLTAGTTYPVRLHFAETYWTAAGDRTFNVSINGTQVLTNFDIFAAAGAANKAVVEQFNAVANASGQIAIVFTSVKDNAAVNGIEVVAPSAPVSAALAVNAGGAAAGSFVADEDFASGATSATAATITTTGVTNPAPTSVYQSDRYGNFTYTMPGYTAGSSHTVRLHFAEIYWTAAGDRTFNVSINGTQVLTNFDIFATAGGENKAIVEQFTTTANAAGQIVIQFTTVVDNAKVSGIEIQ